MAFVALVFFAVGFLALLTLATFFRDGGLEGDFRAAVFFAVGFLALLTLATFFRDAVVPPDALADVLGDVPLT